MVYVGLVLRKGTTIIQINLDMRKMDETEFLNYIWALKKDKKVPFIKWKILIVHGKPTSNYCRLCVNCYCKL